VTLSADLDASFTAGGFDLGAAFGDLAGIFGSVGLPTLDLDVSVSVSVDGLGTGGVASALGSAFGGLDQLTGGLPDVTSLLGPLEAALRLPELVAAFDFDALRADLEAAVAPSGPGLAPLLDATLALGSVPSLGAVADLLAPLGVDLRAPAGLVGGIGGGAVALVTLLGALLTVEATSRALDERAGLVVDVLAADRLAGLVARAQAAGGRQLADLLSGIDPDDDALVEVVARPIEDYLALVAELMDVLVRGLAFAEATIVDSDLSARVTTLGVASALLVESAVAPVRALVLALVPMVDPLVRIEVPEGGADAVFGAAADLGAQLAATVDALPVDTVARLAGEGLDPVLVPLRAVEHAVAELRALIGVVFEPLAAGLRAIDLSAVEQAIESVVTPVAGAIDSVTGSVTGAQGAIEDVVEGVHDALAPVRATLTDAADTITAPFASVHALVAGLDLGALQAEITTTVDSVRAAIESAPVQPVFDVATGIIDVAADALGLVPKALLPDDLRQELEAACAPVEALDLEPTRAELHAQLAAMVDSIDARALDAVAAGFQAVRDFLAGIDPRPHVEALEEDTFETLRGALDQLDPSTLLEPVLDVLAEVQAAIAAIDLAGILAPVDAALDEVVGAIESLDPTELLAPVSAALDSATGSVRAALHLDNASAQLDAVESGVSGFVERLPLTDVLDAVEAAWAGLVAELRGAPGDLDGGILRGVLGGLLPGVDVGGVPEVIAWMRSERDGTVVVRERLARAAGALSGAAASANAIDVGALTVELDGNHQALTAAVAALPPESRLRLRLAPSVSATRPGPDLGLVAMNFGRVTAALAGAAAAVTSTTAADRTEVQRTAGSLGAAFGPFRPAVDAVRRLGAFVGLDPDVLLGPNGLRLAVAGLAEQLGPGPVVGPLRAALTRLADRAVELAGGVIGPLREAIGIVDGVLDALTVDALTADLVAVRDELVALVDGVRPSVVLAAPISALTGLQATLATFDPLGPVTAVVEAMRAEVDAFTTDLAPTALLAPVLDLYDGLASAVGAFDPQGLLEPVLGVLHALEAIIDRGIDEVIDSLADLKVACESEGGVIPGLDLSVAVSVDVGGGFGL
jgi:hypothetical protein